MLKVVATRGLLLAVACPAGPAAAVPASLAVVGFQQEDDNPALIGRSAGALTTIGVDGVNSPATARG